MNKGSLGAGPPIRVTATGTITNPWHSLPPRMFMVGYRAKTERTETWNITPPCWVDLKKHCVQLFFQKDEIVFVFTGVSEAPRYLVNPIRYFFSYRTFINYNLIGGVARDFDPGTFQSMVSIPFTTAEATVDVPVNDVADYLHILDAPLYYALAFYLTGCENPRYFLVEFYKAVEVIENELGGERASLGALADYGVDKKALKAFKKACNDTLHAPVDIGRHAPVPGAPLFSVDLRSLLSEPRSRALFEASTLACRQVIDGYISFRRGQPTQCLQPTVPGTTMRAAAEARARRNKDRDK